jgi:DNA polymerase-3 subunit delta
MEHTSFSQFLKKETLPLYVFTGTEALLKQEVLQNLKFHLGEEKTFFKEWDNENFDIQKFLDDVYSSPLFEEWSLLILKRADGLETILYEAIEQYLKVPAHKSVIVLEFDKLDLRTKFGKMVTGKTDYVVECNPLKEKSIFSSGDNKVVQWVLERATFYKTRINYEAANHLVSISGNNLTDLDSQILKLISFVDNQEIQTEHVTALVSSQQRTNVFDLLEAIFAKNKRLALSLLNQLFERGNVSQDGEVIMEPMHIALQQIRLIHSRLRQLWKVCVSKKTEGIHPYVKQKLSKQASLFSAPKLSLLWHKLLQTEFVLKTSQQSPKLALELFVIFVCENL